MSKLSRALSSLTIECPSCNRPYLVHPSEWQSKRSGTPLGCRGCGAMAPTKRWVLRNVPWLKVVA